MPRTVFAVLALLLVISATARAQPAVTRARAELRLDTDRLRPGQQAIAAVVVTIDDGYHAQSSQPLDENLIPFELSLKADARVTTLDPLYPPGELHNFPALGGKLSVYERRVVAYVPFVVNADAAPGEIELKASVFLQLCNDQTCDAPGTVEASTKTTIVLAGQALKANDDAVFRDFDPNHWLNKHPVVTTTRPADAAPVAASAWTPYGDAALATARATGKPTIVKFTAAWCVNCHVVERRVFGDRATLDELARRGATLIKADLTQDGAPGSALLAKLNPSRSIPFTAVYFPKKDEPAGLTGIYSSADLLAALDGGRGNAWDFSRLPLAAQLGIAVLVGFVLNVVPCVLPVLPLKAMSFYEDAGHDRGRSILNGLLFSAGIVVTFGALAAFVISQAALWSKFISHPLTAAALAIVLLVAAAQAFGLFEVRLPRFVTALEDKAASIGQRPGRATLAYASPGLRPRGASLLAQFFGGALIAILSTPCTVGPFAGIIAAAIYLGLPLGPVLLMFVGVGMALPWLVLSAFPEATRRFPRTGPWPLVVKQMTGFLLVATAIFFAAPLAPTLAVDGTLWWLIFACVAAAAIFLIARTIRLAPRTRPLVIAGCVASLLVAGGLTLTLALTA